MFVGYGINAPEKGWNDYAGVDVKGKTVVILVNDPDWQTHGAERPVRRARDDLLRALDLQVRGSGAAGRGGGDHRPRYRTRRLWLGVVQSSWTGPQLELDDAGRPHGPEPGDRLDHNPAAQALFAAAGKDFAALVAAAKVKGFKAVPLGLKASVGFDNDDPAPGVEERRRRPARHGRSPTNTSSIPRIGTISAAATRWTATTSATARSTMRPASPGWSRWPRRR